MSWVTAMRRTEQGLCIICGKPNNNGQQRCEDCAQALRDYQHKRYYELVAQHRCSHCGRRMPKDWYYITCETCKTKADESRWRKKRGTLDRSVV